MRVLLVEDDADTADAVRRGLARQGYHVTWAPTGHAALTAAAPDFVLLDLGLPDMDGLDVCQELRARGDVPIVIVSGRDSETDKVVGLELGADDYVVKPLRMRELVARMRAVDRRRHRPAPLRAEPDVYGRLTIHRPARRVYLDGTEVPLRPKEFTLLAFLTNHLEELLPRETIMSAVWDTNWYGPTKTLDAHVSVLRRKLGGALRIESVRGIGFRTSLPASAPYHPFG
ncbi:response regulator transcription factor [Streptomyces niveiscabiei]|uniref:response regulator transcription factor n=1 Tax=Streptomyces niveiscabiei TaxID=164115 RepID=UPI0029A29EBF|nr:response regulator transcription factor [Streptomyces niveiscabiei]MDX3384760.1 response regulator transcription factor [Streptomyces niveiscabiei]